MRSKRRRRGGAGRDARCACRLRPHRMHTCSPPHNQLHCQLSVLRPLLPPPSTPASTITPTLHRHAHTSPSPSPSSRPLPPSPSSPPPNITPMYPCLSLSLCVLAGDGSGGEPAATQCARSGAAVVSIGATGGDAHGQPSVQPASLSTLRAGLLVKSPVRGHLFSSNRRRFFTLTSLLLEWSMDQGIPPHGHFALVGASLTRSHKALELMRGAEALKLNGDSLDEWERLRCVQHSSLPTYRLISCTRQRQPQVRARPSTPSIKL